MTWQIQTTARQILPTGTRFIMINPMAIRTVTIPTMEHFVFNVMVLQSFPDASYTTEFPGTIHGAVWSFWQSRKQLPCKKTPLAKSAVPRLWFQIPDKASQVPSIQSGSDSYSHFFLRFLIFTYLFHSRDIFLSLVHRP